MMHNTTVVSKVFTNTELLIVAQLQAAHLRDVAALKQKINHLETQLCHEKATVSDLVKICDYEHVGLFVCDHCRRINSDDDGRWCCEECGLRLCVFCNNDGQRSRINVGDDGGLRCEVCKKV